MSDRVFFSLIILLAALMVTASARPGVDNLPRGPIGGADTDYKTITVEGLQLNRIIAGGDDAMGIVEREGEPVLMVESLAGTQNRDPIKGPHFELDSDLERVFSDHEVEVTITARPTERKGAHSFQVNYSAGRPGESGWQTFDMIPDWREYSFIYRVPEKTGDNAFDYLGIRPVVPEDMRSILIKRITFQRFEKRQTGDDA